MNMQFGKETYMKQAVRQKKSGETEERREEGRKKRERKKPNPKPDQLTSQKILGKQNKTKLQQQNQQQKKPHHQTKTPTPCNRIT